MTKKDDSGRFPLHHLCRHLAPNYTSSKMIYSKLLGYDPSSVKDRNNWESSALQDYWNHVMNSNGDDYMRDFSEIAELLLKCLFHETLNVPIQQWRLIHAAVSVGCPRAYLTYLLSRKGADLNDRDNEGHTPLMKSIVKSSRFVPDFDFEDEEMDDNYLDESLHEDECIPSSMMLLLKNNINAASIPDTNGQLPLHKALEKKSKWEREVKMLVNAAPNALCTRDKLSHLYPFMMAANKNSLDICYQ